MNYLSAAPVWTDPRWTEDAPEPWYSLSGLPLVKKFEDSLASKQSRLERARRTCTIAAQPSQEQIDWLTAEMEKRKISRRSVSRHFSRAKDWLSERMIGNRAWQDGEFEMVSEYVLSEGGV